jgi:hypothetical protein
MHVYMHERGNLKSMLLQAFLIVAGTVLRPADALLRAQLEKSCAVSVGCDSVRFPH